MPRNTLRSVLECISLLCSKMPSGCQIDVVSISSLSCYKVLIFSPANGSWAVVWDGEQALLCLELESMPYAVKTNISSRHLPRKFLPSLHGKPELLHWTADKSSTSVAQTLCFPSLFHFLTWRRVSKMMAVNLGTSFLIFLAWFLLQTAISLVKEGINTVFLYYFA